MIRLRIETTTDYDKLIKLFVENELEFSEEEPVPTDLIKCWKVAHGNSNAVVGGIALAMRQGEYIIDGIAVDKIYRKMNIGKLLLEKAIKEVRKLGGKSLYLVARAPEFFRKNGFYTVGKEEAPNFFECLTCPQYGVNCHPEIMKLEV